MAITTSTSGFLLGKRLKFEVKRAFLCFSPFSAFVRFPRVLKRLDASVVYTNTLRMGESIVHYRRRHGPPRAATAVYAHKPNG